MNAAFHDALQLHRSALQQVLVTRLRESDAPHYQRVDPELLRARVSRFIDAFIGAAYGDHRPFLDFLERLVEERIGEGYHLTEIQTLMNVLAEEAWAIAVDHSNVRDLVGNLSLVSTLVRDAKDRLAQIYLSHKLQADTKVVALERKLNELFKGTESGATLG
jgi:hypothetical protein